MGFVDLKWRNVQSGSSFINLPFHECFVPTFLFFVTPWKVKALYFVFLLLRNSCWLTLNCVYIFLVWRNSVAPSTWANMLPWLLSAAALTPPWKVLFNKKLVELKILEFGDHMNTGTSASDNYIVYSYLFWGHRSIFIQFIFHFLTILVNKNPSYYVHELQKFRRYHDLEALKFAKGYCDYFFKNAEKK